MGGLLQGKLTVGLSISTTSMEDWLPDPRIHYGRFGNLCGIFGGVRIEPQESSRGGESNWRRICSRTCCGMGALERGLGAVPPGLLQESQLPAETATGTAHKRMQTHRPPLDRREVTFAAGRHQLGGFLAVERQQQFGGLPE